MDKFYDGIKKCCAESKNQDLFAKLAEVTDEESKNKILNEIVEDNLERVLLLAECYNGLTDFDFDEIFSAGTMGLLEAAREFPFQDKERSFSKFCTMHIQKGIAEQFKLIEERNASDVISLEEPFFETSGVYTAEGFKKKQRMFNDGNACTNAIIKNIDDQSKVQKVYKVLGMADPAVAMICKDYWGIDQDERVDINEISDQFGVEKATIYSFINTTRNEIKREFGLSYRYKPLTENTK